MKNLLTDLQNHLFEMIETLNDPALTGDELDQEIKRALAVNEIAKTAVANGALMVKAADTLYGLPVSDQLPLIPPSPAETPVIIDSKRKGLISIPRAENSNTRCFI
jgi:hypothetical protein